MALGYADMSIQDHMIQRIFDSVHHHNRPDRAGKAVDSGVCDPLGKHCHRAHRAKRWWRRVADLANLLRRRRTTRLGQRWTFCLQQCPFSENYG